jgi:N-acyl-D-amino-acid deacylase
VSADRSGLTPLLQLLPVLLLGGCASLGPSTASDYDLVIRNGRVLDGAGNPWIAADIGIRDGRFARIGRIEGRGRKEIDAAGKYVSPGWIDVMDQSGDQLAKNGLAENKVRMGVTSAIAGEGGFPSLGHDRQIPPEGIGDYFALLERQGISLNFGTYYGATQARIEVMGDVDGKPTPAQLEQMKERVARAMQGGAFGITTALIYPPSSFHSTEELIELAKVASKYKGIYASHLRDEGKDLLKALHEAIEIGEKGGVQVEVFHLKAAYAPLWRKLMPQAVQLIDQARARGVNIAADMYPYPAGGTGLEITVPSWVFAQGHDKALERLKDPSLRARLKKEVAAGSQPGWSNLVEACGGWDHIVLADPHSAQYEQYKGKSIAAIGKVLKKDPADVAWDIVIAGQPHRAMALFFMMDEADIELALKQPWVAIGSDAAAADHGKVDALGLRHPRSYGTFPRVIAEYVNKRGVLSLADAIRKMTSWPAARMGLADRGVIREGLWADLVVFDLERIKDRSTWDEPFVYPAGIDHVLVNGVVVVENGEHTGARPGKVLRGPGYGS